MRNSSFLPVILTVAFLLRLGLPGTIGLDHFDEGVYASAADSIFLSSSLFEMDPAVIPYGPPMTPVLIAMCEFVFGGPSDFASVFPGIVCGSLAVGMAWHIGRSAFDMGAGRFAAVLLACSGMAIAFGRSALTEGPLCLSWLVAMAAGMSFLDRPGPRTAIWLGASVGLAQLTKYNGGLTGLIVALTALSDYGFGSRRLPRDTGLFLRRMAWGSVAAVLAFLVYAPWFFFVERHGGYSELLRHHGQYVQDVARWIPQLRLQLAQAWQFQAQTLAAGVAVVGLVWVTPCDIPIGFRRIDRLRILFAATLVCFVPNAGWAISLCTVPHLWNSGLPARRMLGMWLIVMSAVTPIYHPYARLWLPTHLASILVVAGWMSAGVCRSVHITESEPRNLLYGRTFVATLAVVASVGIWSVSFAGESGSKALPSVWAGRTAMGKALRKYVPVVRESTSRGQTVHLLLSPTGRRTLGLSLPPGGIGPGRLAVLADLSGWQRSSGPLLADLAAMTDADRRILATAGFVPRETRLSNSGGTDTTESNRGLITLLDLAPGAALGDSLPSTDVVWFDP